MSHCGLGQDDLESGPMTGLLQNKWTTNKIQFFQC